MAKNRNFVSVSTYVNVDVDLSEIDTDDLVEELQSRDTRFTKDPDVSLDQIYKEFAFNNPTKAMQLTKKYIEDTLGKTLN